LADGAGDLSGGLNQLQGNVPDLVSGVEQLADGANRLEAGLKELQSKVPALTDGVSQLSDGADQLEAGLKQLNGQVPALVDGVNQLAAGGTRLSAGLNGLEAGLDARFGPGLNKLATDLTKAAGTGGLADQVIAGINAIKNTCAANGSPNPTCVGTADNVIDQVGGSAPTSVRSQVQEAADGANALNNGYKAPLNETDPSKSGIRATIGALSTGAETCPTVWTLCRLSWGRWLQAWTS
jgi:X-X-X-Leu-X-X-Gly heptad repeat protein